jgi:hypothetical protein
MYEENFTGTLLRSISKNVEAMSSLKFEHTVDFSFHPARVKGVQSKHAPREDER